MKNLHNIILRGNMTPLERVTALVHNDIHREKTGKDMLSESQRHALTKGWAGQIGQINEYKQVHKYRPTRTLHATGCADVCN